MIIEFAAVCVAGLAAYLAWRGLVVMNATMQMARAVRDEAAAQRVASTLVALGMAVQTLAKVHKSAHGDHELATDEVHRAHWLAARMAVVQRLDQMETEARAAVATAFPSHDSTTRAQAAIEMMHNTTAKFDDHQPLESSNELFEALTTEAGSAGHRLIRVAEEFASLGKSAAVSLERHERRGRSPWRP